jgi:hypothetical protein
MFVHSVLRHHNGYNTRKASDATAQGTDPFTHFHSRACYDRTLVGAGT